ncbi:MAG: sugar phosphate isomerase/epimerase [Acidobacteriaceae bacterium]|nr:sugar phosphate isomerase/epimerase [Acidobacteriaceae bacterium]
MAEPSPSTKSKMGIATTSYMMAWRPKDTLGFLEHCHDIGASGIQAPINGDVKKIRARAEKLGMYIEAMVPMPKNGDTSQFEEAVRAAKEVGAIALRTDCLGTRRYETFDSNSAWQEHVARTRKSIEAVRPIVERYKIPLGIENHKDWTADQLVALIKQYGGEYLGVCLDFGNNLSLLDGLMDVIEKLAPYAVCTHVKDMGVDNYNDGFLLSEVVFGTGCLDLGRAISLVRQARPEVKFTLEMITRDPLQVPCLSDRYWATFPDRNGLYLARTLKFVQEHRSPTPLPRVSQLSKPEHEGSEITNVVACLVYAHDKLGV